MDRSFKGGGITVPSHSYIDHAAYFITAATYQHQRLLNDEIKTILRDLLHEVFTEYNWTLDHWVILDNHYHILANSHTGRDLSKIVSKIHNLSAQRINQLFPPQQRPYEKVWCNYWDYCPRNERDYNIRLCYLLNNPVKHGYVKNLHDWQWSSFADIYQQQDEKLRKLFKDHKEYRDLILPEDRD